MGRGPWLGSEARKWSGEQVTKSLPWNVFGFFFSLINCRVPPRAAVCSCSCCSLHKRS